jgi:hypothetical protein
MKTCGAIDKTKHPNKGELKAQDGKHPSPVQKKKPPTNKRCTHSTKREHEQIKYSKSLPHLPQVA